MLSLPRDLRVLIPGVGYDKMNAAFSYGGAALVVKTFTELTGLPINHYVEVDFAGFWHAVNILGGVYIPVDHRYYNPESSSYKSIDIEPGYQLMRGHDALDFVRYRHDNLSDFGRMQRQQLFLKEMQRQSGRWSKDWTKVTQLIKELTQETTSDIDSLSRIKPLVELVFQVDTSKFNTVHLEGATPTIDGVSYVVASTDQIAAAVTEFTEPEAAPMQGGAVELRKKDYTVTVINGSGQDGFTRGIKAQLKALGYHAYDGHSAAEFPGSTTTIYTPAGLEAQARTIGALFGDAEIKVVSRAPGSTEGILVFVASSFDGTLDVPQPAYEVQQTLQPNANQDLIAWQTLSGKTKLPLEMPATWVSGCVYDEFYAYTLTETSGRKSSAAVAVARTPAGNYWSVQALRWLSPPAIANPNGKETINGQEYLLFYQGKKLHMVAWKRNATLYWVLNSINNELSEKTMRALATSCTPVT
jgi:LCP family protein required for cell wall assembly